MYNFKDLSGAAEGLEKWYGRRGQLSQNKVALHLTKCSKRITHSKNWHYTQKKPTYRILSNIGAAKYRLCRRFKLEPKNSRAGQRAPKLGRCLRAAIRMVLEVARAQVLSLTGTINFSGCSEYMHVSGKNNKNMLLVSVISLCSLNHARVAGM